MNLPPKLQEKKVNLERFTLSELQERGLEHLLPQPKVRNVSSAQQDARFKLKYSQHKAKSVQDKTWYSISYWHLKLEKEWFKLTSNQRAHYSVELMKLLANKLNTLPSDAIDSVTNASETLALIKSIEATNSSISSSIINTKTLDVEVKTLEAVAVDVKRKVQELNLDNLDLCKCELDQDHFKSKCQELRKELGLTSIDDLNPQTQISELSDSLQKSDQVIEGSSEVLSPALSQELTTGDPTKQ